jgi:hypothetical protein
MARRANGEASMAEYSDIPGMIPEMKLAAIDSFMGEQGWFTHIWYPDRYSLWGFIGASSYERPDANGEGGGAPIEGGFTEAGESMAPTFASIRGWIDDLVDPWLDLPDGSDCAAPQSATRAAAAAFGASGTGTDITDTGELGRRNQTVADVIVGNIQGSFTTPFHDKYYVQFANVTSGLGIGCAILESNYAAQAALWPAARRDAATILGQTRDALTAHAGQLSDDMANAVGSISLTVVATVLGAVASIATAGAAAPLVIAMVSVAGAATVGLDVLDTQAAITGDTYSELLQSAGDSLSKLNERITDLENAYATMMSGAVDEIRGNLPGYDLDAYVMPSYPGAAGTLAMQTVNTDMITFNMGKIVELTQGAADALGSSPDSNPTPRDARLGRGASGTHLAAQELYDLTARCLELTIAEYQRGKGLFDATVEDFFDTDQAASTTVKNLAASEILIDELGV